jgi:hypothetical protein
MSCDVCITADYGAPFAEWSVEVQLANADLKCYECHCTIPAGVQYQHVTAWYDEGEPTTYTTCLGCSQCRTVYCCGTELYGEFWSTLFEDTPLAQFAMAGECWESLGLAGKAKFVEMWRKEAGL